MRFTGSQSSSADSSLILLTPRSQVSAAKACAELGETLWTPESKTASIQTNLDYLSFQGKYTDDQLYWIAPTTTAKRAIDGKGRIANSTTFSPHSQLPAFCTQSAPFSDISA